MQLVLESSKSKDQALSFGYWFFTLVILMLAVTGTVWQIRNPHEAAIARTHVLLAILAIMFGPGGSLSLTVFIFWFIPQPDD